MIKIEGLEEMQRKLQELQHRVEAVAGEHEVSLKELFPDEFMLLNTDFDSIDAMFDASGFTVNSRADFEAIPDEAWNAFVAKRTRFATWKEMTAAAAQEYLSRKLEL